MISYQYLKLCHMCNISIMKISGLPLIKQNVYITKIAFPETKIVNNGTCCSPFANQIFGVGLRLVASVTVYRI